MDSLQNILANKKFTPPDEMSLIKDYVKRKYSSPCSVKLQNGAVVVSVKNSALAGTLFLERQELISACNLQKRLVIKLAH